MRSNNEHFNARTFVLKSTYEFLCRINSNILSAEKYVGRFVCHTSHLSCVVWLLSLPGLLACYLKKEQQLNTPPSLLRVQMISDTSRCEDEGIVDITIIIIIYECIMSATKNDYYHGSCLCKTIKIQAESNQKIFSVICHCTIRQRLGSATGLALVSLDFAVNPSGL